MFTPESLLSFMDKQGINYKLYHHPAVGCGDCAHLFPQVDGVILKNLVLTTKKGRLVLFTLPLEVKADLKKLAQSLTLPRFSFARSGDLAFLGVPPGMVSPLALLNDVGQEMLYVEPVELDALPLVNCHPLRNTMSIDIALCDLHQLVQASGHHIVQVPGVLID